MSMNEFIGVLNDVWHPWGACYGDVTVKVGVGSYQHSSLLRR